MEMEIVVIDADDTQCHEVCTMLEGLDYRATPMYSFQDLQKHLKTGACRVIIVDLEMLSADKNLFYKLKRMKPSTYIMGLSSRSFHPELEEFMSSRIYACLSKPVDEEELSFWIKSII